MLPQGAEVRAIGSLIYWRNHKLMLNAGQAQLIADEVLRLAQDPAISLMLVDNRGTHGAWTQEAELVWGQLMVSLQPQLTRVATLGSHFTQAQLNVLAKETGSFEQIRAFAEPQQALAFLGLPLTLLDCRSSILQRSGR